MADKKVVELLVSGGQANAGPPLGPALGPLGVNVMAIVNKINELTKDYSGMKVPVKVIVDPDTKAFEVTVGTPTASALIVSELKVEKGSGYTKHSQSWKSHYRTSHTNSKNEAPRTTIENLEISRQRNPRRLRKHGSHGGRKRSARHPKRNR